MTVWRRIAAILVLACTTAHAADEWTLTTADFNTRPVTPEAIDNDVLAVTIEGGASEKVPLTNVVSLTRNAKPARPSGLVLFADDGQRLVGYPARLDSTNLVWHVTGLGDVKVPLERAVAIVRDQATPAAQAPATEDVARLLSGDVMRGILSKASGNSFEFTPAAGGDPTTVAANAVASVVFATPPNGRKPAEPPAFLVHTGRGSVAAVQTVQLAQKTLRVRGPATATIPLTEIVAIEHTGGPVAWLSARQPTESIHTPYLGGSLPARFDTDVLGNPIRVGGVTYSHGIGVHSRSKLLFAVVPGDKTFRTRYAIDGSLSRADVDVRVLVDGKVVHEQKGFKAGTLSPVVTADVSGAKTITLEVDYGQGYDVQDRLNWIEPAIVRN